MKLSSRAWGWFAIGLAVLLVLAVPLPASSAATVERIIHIQAKRFEYSPSLIQVNPGDRVTIKLEAGDVMHGLSIDGYNLNVTADPGQPARLTFIADKTGSYRFRCSVTCGNMHPFMIGKLQVGSNALYWRAVGPGPVSPSCRFVGIAAMKLPSAMKQPVDMKHLTETSFPREKSLLERSTLGKRTLPLEGKVLNPGTNIPYRVDLAQIPWIRPLLQSHWPQFLARSITLAGFVLTILAGLFGSAVGSHNFAIIFVWIAWWTALKLVFIPFGGRSWCSICPIPMPGEWLQQGSLIERTQKRLGLGLRWPRRLKGTWLQSGGFLLIGLFSALTLTDPRVTAWVLMGLIVLAMGLSLVFENRAFCSYVCPIGGFTGIYAQAAPVEVRVNDASLCAAHEEKSCYTACPWGLYPLALRNSVQCGLCMECLRACPKDNIRVNLRPFGSDLGMARQTQRLDEAFLALVMLGSAIAFSAVFTGPWGALKSAAFTIGSTAWLLYALAYLTLTLGLLPGLFILSVWAGKKWSGSKVPLRRLISNASQILLPLGLCAWIAFTISFAFPKISYVFSVISDPFGWGWNLFGAAGRGWSPDVAGFGPALQAVLVLAGLVWAGIAAHDLVEKDQKRSVAIRQMTPVLVFCAIFSISILWLLVG